NMIGDAFNRPIKKRPACDLAAILFNHPYGYLRACSERWSYLFLDLLRHICLVIIFVNRCYEAMLYIGDSYFKKPTQTPMAFGCGPIEGVVGKFLHAEFVGAQSVRS